MVPGDRIVSVRPGQGVGTCETARTDADAH